MFVCDSYTNIEGQVQKVIFDQIDGEFQNWQKGGNREIEREQEKMLANYISLALGVIGFVFNLYLNYLINQRLF